MPSCDWVRRRLREFAAGEGEERVARAVHRFRAADAQVMAALSATERAAFGFSLSSARGEVAMEGIR